MEIYFILYFSLLFFYLLVCCEEKDKFCVSNEAKIKSSTESFNQCEVAFFSEII